MLWRAGDGSQTPGPIAQRAPSATDRTSRVGEPRWVHTNFHALRCTIASWAALKSVLPMALQTLMRHSSIVKSLNTDGALLLDEASETVGKMPMAAPVRLRMTGAEGDALPDGPPQSTPQRQGERERAGAAECA